MNTCRHSNCKNETLPDKVFCYKHIKGIAPINPVWGIILLYFIILTICSLITKI